MILMETLIEKVDPVSPETDIIARAGKILMDGGLVAFPTETVYGLGGDALNPASSEKIYAAKGRPSDNPLIVHIADLKDLRRVAASVPESAEKLMAEYWPGPLTMIFPKTEEVPLATTGGLPTVAVRFPSHPAARALIRAAGGFVAAPSANLSGRPSPTSAKHVEEDLSGRIEMILDGGESTIGLESTIVDFTEEIPVILRPGFINYEMLRDVLGEVKVDPGILSENEHVRPKAPGMRYRHYAPKAPLIVIEGERDRVTEKIRRSLREAAREGRRAAVLCSDETAAAYEAEAEQIRSAFSETASEQEGAAPYVMVSPIGSLTEDESIARHLFGELRRFDAENIAIIYSEAFDTPRLGQAIMNRLLKAAGHTVVKA